MGQPPALGRNDVHVWTLAVPDNLEGVRLSLVDIDYLLNHTDRVRYEKYRLKNKKMEMVISRFFIWKILGKYLKKNEREIRIENDSYGKPFLFCGLKRVPLYFNLSHTKKIISCVVSLHQPLGVDVEYHEQKNTIDWESVFTSRERKEYFQEQVPSEKGFYELWTLKEAYLKADGRGLFVPLDSFSFSLNKKEETKRTIQINFHDTEKKNAERWCFRLFEPTPRHSLAVAVQLETVPLFHSMTLEFGELALQGY